MSEHSREIACPYCGTAHHPEDGRQSLRCACGQVIACGAAPRAAATGRTGSGLDQAAAMYAGRIPRSRYTEEAAPSGRSRLWRATGVAATIVGTVVAAWALLNPSSKLPGPIAGDDVKIVKYMEDSPPIEARRWLSERSGRMLGGMTPVQANRFVDTLYGMGAQEVYCFGGQMCLAVVVHLPDSAAERKAIFDWRLKYGGDYIEPPPADVGQRYMFVRVKP